MERMVVATDLSPRSDRAVARAFVIASQFKVKLELVSVVDEDLPGDIAERARLEFEARMAQFAAAQKGADKVDYSVSVTVDDPVGGLVAAAAGADLLIMGLHRRRPLMDMFVSTTLEKVIRATETPVLVVKDPADHPYSRILAALDLSPASTAAIALARTLAPDAECRAFHAFRIAFKGFVGGESAGAQSIDRREAEKALAKWRESAGDLSELAVEVIENSPNGAMRECIDAFSPQLIVIGAHGRNALNPYLLGSFAAELLADPPVDLLVTSR